MYKVIRSTVLSKEWNDRFVVIDGDTGEILDDAQGYGYKTPKNAHAAWGYKNRDRSKDAEKLAKHRAVAAFCMENRRFVNNLEQSLLYAYKDGCPEEFNAEFIQDMFDEEGFTGLPFSAGDFLKYWNKPLPMKRRKKKTRR